MTEVIMNECCHLMPSVLHHAYMHNHRSPITAHAHTSAPVVCYAVRSSSLCSSEPLECAGCPLLPVHRINQSNKLHEHSLDKNRKEQNKHDTASNASLGLQKQLHTNNTHTHTHTHTSINAPALLAASLLSGCCFRWLQVHATSMERGPA